MTVLVMLGEWLPITRLLFVCCLVLMLFAVLTVSERRALLERLLHVRCLSLARHCSETAMR